MSGRAANNSQAKPRYGLGMADTDRRPITLALATWEYLDQLSKLGTHGGGNHRQGLPVTNAWRCLQNALAGDA
jgi:hypothetical protein